MLKTIARMTEVITQPRNTILENGLKSQISRQVGLKNWEHQTGKNIENHLIVAWKKMCSLGLENEVSELIWDYNNDGKYIYTNSVNVNILSNIGTYENKKGVKSLAHYTNRGHYIGSVSKCGTEPIPYDGWFIISKTYFKIDFTKLNTIEKIGGEYKFSSLFTPINQPTKPINQPKKPINQPTKKKLIIEDDDE